MITPGARYGTLTVLSRDPLGRRCAVFCSACGGNHVFSAQALHEGARCHTAPMTKRQRNALRIEAAERARAAAPRWK
jgi:hypothetical protein